MKRFVGLMFVACFAACSSSTGLKTVSLEAKSSVVASNPITIHTIVTARNLGDETILLPISSGGCGNAILAFDTPERNGTPVWSSAFVGPCTSTLEAQVVTLAPGDYYDYNLTGTVPASLAAGGYFLSADLGYRRVPAGQFSK